MREQKRLLAWAAFLIHLEQESALISSTQHYVIFAFRLTGTSHTTSNNVLGVLGLGSYQPEIVYVRAAPHRTHEAAIYCDFMQTFRRRKTSTCLLTRSPGPTTKLGAQKVGEGGTEKLQTKMWIKSSRIINIVQHVCSHKKFSYQRRNSMQQKRRSEARASFEWTFAHTCVAEAENEKKAQAANTDGRGECHAK